MDNWDNAATETAKKICERIDVHQSMVQDFGDIITDAHADLRRTYKKLVELAKIYPELIMKLDTLARWFDLEQKSHPEWKGTQVQDDLRKFRDLLGKTFADPDVIAAMEGEEG